MAEVLHFYGLAWTDMINMPFAWFCKLYARIPVVRARTQIAWIPAIAYAHMGDNQTRYMQTLQELSKPEHIRQREADGTADTGAISAGWDRLRAMGMKAANKAGE